MCACAVKLKINTYMLRNVAIFKEDRKKEIFDKICYDAFWFLYSKIPGLSM